MPGFTARPEIRGTFGVVATTHWLASAVGMSVLERGGNAFDAAVAVGFTLQVVEPHLNGPLGEAPILVYSAKNRRCDMICGQGVAPAAATIACYKDLGLDLIPGTGLLAATVPGAFDAWMRLLRDYGTMPLGELIAPALGYAENGYPVVGRIRDTIATVAELFRREWPTSAAVLLPGGNPPDPGKLFRNPQPRPPTAAFPEAEAGGGRASADRPCPRCVVSRPCSPGDRPLLPHPEGARRVGAAARRPDADDRLRWQAPGRGAADLRLPRLYGGQGRPRGARVRCCCSNGIAQGFDLDSLDPTGPVSRPYRHRMRQARLCRPRGLVRRPRILSMCRWRPAEPGLQHDARASW
jgi:gamma-glutamyltranspeptidase/glutathione hydrolase